MNWIGIHPLAGRGDPEVKPVSQTVLSKPNLPSHHDGWIGARVESYRLRQKFVDDFISAIQVPITNYLTKSRWLRMVRR